MYTITYEDGDEYQVDELSLNPSINQEKWSLINKPIRKFEYSLNGKTFIMENYEMFNHLIEYTHISVRKNLIITKITLMGLSGNLVTAIVLNIKKKRIEQYQATLGKEYNGGLTTGWRKGTKDLNPDYSIS